MNTEAEEIAALQANIRASLRQQIDQAADIATQAEAHQRIVREAWTCMASTFVRVSELPELEPEHWTCSSS